MLFRSGSSEDFDVMFHKTDADVIYRSQVSFYTRKFILTQGARPVELRADDGFKKQYSVASVPNIVSTIGAGDNFNAGFVYGMLRHNIRRDDIERGLTEQQWDGLIASAQTFSADVCQSLDNYVSEPFARQRRAELNA